MKNWLVLFFLLSIIFSIQAQKNSCNLLIGTYTNSCESKGIYAYEFDLDTGKFKFKSASEDIINPSYLTVSKDNQFVYAVNEAGSKSTVSALRLDVQTGKLDFINKQNAEGADPCYIINDDKNVIIANYSGGNISVFGKNEDGGLTHAKQVVPHFGQGINTNRQESSHVHMVCFSPDKKYILANDLGTDALYIYKYNPNAANNVLVLKEIIAVKSGSGPRHLSFSPNGKFVYLLHELDGTVTVFHYKKGTLKKIEESKVTDSNFEGNIGAAAIYVSPDGKFLYASNRGDANAISVFKILKNGKIEKVGQSSTLGKGPRNFTIDPAGKFLLVANQYSNEVVVFSIDKKSGLLTDTKNKLNLCSPVCLVFIMP
jgi:6-phosphogluconolactonase